MFGIVALFVMMAALPSTAQDGFVPLGDIAKMKQVKKPARLYTNDDFPEVVEVASAAPAPAQPASAEAKEAEKPAAAAPLPVACGVLQQLKDDRDRLRRKADRLNGYLEKATSEMQKQIYNNALKRLEEELVIANVELDEFRANEDISACEEGETETTPESDSPAAGE
jgi:hypothetical protein